jgi:hypothetical protein
VIKRFSSTPDINPQVVAQYLRAHPDFFNENIDLLAKLRIPHPCRPAVSLVERQLEILRDQNAQLQKKLRELVDVARDNDRVSLQMQRLALMLIEATELEEIIHGVESILRDEFHADFAALRLAAQPVASHSIDAQTYFHFNMLPLFESILNSGRPRCGRISDEQLRALFDESGPRVASAAAIPLKGVDWQGILALGSRDETRFHPGMGAVFLARMGEMIGYALERHLRVPAARIEASPPALSGEQDS